ncbi:MAG TPA: hypothetical protein VI876_13460, partial [Dehalococcoidia bacterium]|nr:hypothetical protein [Dehalococcoidia bacterium]
MAVAVVLAGWFWPSSQTAHADGGLLGDALSLGDSPSDTAGQDSGILGSVTDTVATAANTLTGTA